MTHKFTIKPLIKAGIFSLLVGGVFAILAKLGANKKRVPQSPSTIAEETSEEGSPSTIAEQTSEEGSPSTIAEQTSEENNNTEKIIDHGSTNTTKRSPLSMTPDPMKLRTHWHRKYKWKRN